MDRYTFRGKRADNGAWETGSLVILRKGCHDEQTFIADKMTGFLTPVDRKTVGQCTGMGEKGGKAIFEGDIVYIDDWECTTAVYFHQGSWFLKFAYCDEYLYEMAEDCVIIGNIHDNPELLNT